MAHFHYRALSMELFCHLYSALQYNFVSIQKFHMKEMLKERNSVFHFMNYKDKRNNYVFRSDILHERLSSNNLDISDWCIGDWLIFTNSDLSHDKIKNNVVWTCGVTCVDDNRISLRILQLIWWIYNHWGDQVRVDKVGKEWAQI
jgi:hypothetical protein